ncbi:MAG TPA: ABC transporter permease [Acetobacteraceae bacterium]|nr:ABC transporter permease [Acetobacteraceae bacterium]
MPESEQRQAGTALVLLGPATLLMVVMLLGPLALLARFSLNRFDPTEIMVAALTPENYARFFTDPFYRDVLVTTVRVSVIVTIACLIFGLPMAWRLARSTSRLKSVWLTLIILPLFIGAVTRTSGWMILFARGGMLDIVGRLFGAGRVDVMFTENAVIAGIVSINLPFTILALQSVFEGIDPRLQEAAASMGATPARAFRRVIFPLALPGVLIAAVLCFILCMNAFATPVLLGGPRFHMMAPLIYWEFTNNNNWAFAAALAFILMATTLGLTGLANVVIPRRYRVGR